LQANLGKISGKNSPEENKNSGLSWPDKNFYLCSHITSKSLLLYR